MTIPVGTTNESLPEPFRLRVTESNWLVENQYRLYLVEEMPLKMNEIWLSTLLDMRRTAYLHCPSVHQYTNSDWRERGVPSELESRGSFLVTETFSVGAPRHAFHDFVTYTWVSLSSVPYYLYVKIKQR